MSLPQALGGKEAQLGDASRTQFGKGRGSSLYSYRWNRFFVFLERRSVQTGDTVIRDKVETSVG